MTINSGRRIGRRGRHDRRRRKWRKSGRSREKKKFLLFILFFSHFSSHNFSSSSFSCFSSPSSLLPRVECVFLQYISGIRQSEPVKLRLNKQISLNFYHLLQCFLVNLGVYKPLTHTRRFQKITSWCDDEKLALLQNSLFSLSKIQN